MTSRVDELFLPDEDAAREKADALERAVASPAALAPPRLDFRARHLELVAGDFDVVDMTREEAFALLDRHGLQAVVGMLTNGNLPVHVARTLGVPPMLFNDWLEERLTDEERNTVWRIAAEAMQNKSLLVLTRDTNSQAEAMLARAMSDRFAAMAEAIDPERWKSKPTEREVAPPPITIIMEPPKEG